jgi:transposase
MVVYTDDIVSMKMFVDVGSVYLHRDPVDFRKSINGLSVIVEQSMGLAVFDSALFLFCNKQRDKLKILYWDSSGFCLWYKRLEKERFKWPRKNSRDVVTLNEEQLHWLLRGFDINQLKAHKNLHYCSGF